MNMSIIGKFLKKYAPVIIMTIFTAIDGVSMVQQEDEMEQMRKDIAYLKEQNK